MNVIKELLNADDILVNQADNKGRTPLYTACEKNYSNVIKELLKVNGIKINQAMKNGATPLIIATYLGNFAAVEILLSNELIDTSLLFEDRTAAHYTKANNKVASWSFLDKDVSEEGRVKCKTLLRSHATTNHKNK